MPGNSGTGAGQFRDRIRPLLPAFADKTVDEDAENPFLEGLMVTPIRLGEDLSSQSGKTVFAIDASVSASSCGNFFGKVASCTADKTKGGEDMDEVVPASPAEPTTWQPAADQPPTAVRREHNPNTPSDHAKGGGPAHPSLWGKTIETRCNHPGAVRIRERSLADALLAEIEAPPVKVKQDGSAGSSAHRFHVVLLLEGSGTYQWERGTAKQRPGDIVLVDIAEPSEVVSPIESQLLRWSFPETVIAPFLPLRDACPVLHLPARTGLMNVIAQHTRQLACEADRLDHTAQHGLLTHLCGLLGLAMEAEATPTPARRCNYRSFQRQRVLSYIETHLRDPHCTAKRAAHDLGMSARWLHALLENMADSFSGIVARRRLERSLVLLQDPASDHLSITEIAFLSGFNDLSTFYRRFGEHYGTTPRAARRRKSLQTGGQRSI
jgi:AraC-like DNA-binding protein